MKSNKNCKFFPNCSRLDCKFTHPTAADNKVAESKVDNKPIVEKIKPLLIPDCKFFPNCTKLDCKFIHPTAADNCRSKVDNKYTEVVVEKVKPLLILDVNGLLIFRNVVKIQNIEPNFSLNGKFVYYRPHFKEFLTFCFQHFQVGFWSTATNKNMMGIITDLMKIINAEPVFCFFQNECVNTGMLTSSKKPIFLKYLQTVFDKYPQFNYNNTCIIDDTLYKTFINLPYSAILSQEWTGDFSDNNINIVDSKLYTQLKYIVDNFNTTVCNYKFEYSLMDAYYYLSNIDADAEMKVDAEAVKSWICSQTIVNKQFPETDNLEKILEIIKTRDGIIPSLIYKLNNQKKLH